LRSSVKLSIDILIDLRCITYRHLPISEKQYYLMKSAQANVSRNTFKRLEPFLNTNNRFQLLYLLDRLYVAGARIKCGALLIPNTVPSDVANAIFQKHPVFNCNINTTNQNFNEKFREELYAVEGSGH